MSGRSRARCSSHSPKARNKPGLKINGVGLTMSENDKWAWFSEDDPIPALFRTEPSTSKTDSPGLRLDVTPPGAAKTPAGSASLGKAVALHLEGKTDAAVKELQSAIAGGEHLAELYPALGHLQFEQQKFADA